MFYSKDEVERRAYWLYIARGRQHGRDLDDWLTAERQLAQERLETPEQRLLRVAVLATSALAGGNHIPRRMRS